MRKVYSCEKEFKRKEIKMQFVAILFFTFCAIAGLFQFALALGAPWGEYTMGGRFPGKLPPTLRIAALFQIMILFFFAFTVSIKSGLAFGQFDYIGRVAIWFVVAFLVLGSILNLSTPSKKERMIWGPVNILLLTTSIMVALSS